MPSFEIKSSADTSSFLIQLVEKGLSQKSAKRVNDLVIQKADALRRRGETEVDIRNLGGLIDNILSLPKGELRCFVIISARNAIESLIDREQKTA